MSDISISRQHGTTLKRARASADRIAAELAEEFDLSTEWDGNTLNFERAGVTGTLVVSKKEIVIEAHLGFMMRMIKPVIEREANRFLDGEFGPADS